MRFTKQQGIYSMLFLWILVVFPNAYADEGEGLAVGDRVEEFFEGLRVHFQGSIDDGFDEDSEFNFLNTTDDELDEVLDSAVDTGIAGKDFFFAFHHLFESIAFAISPIALAGIIVSIVAAFFGVLIILKMGGNVTKHLFVFLAVLLAISLVFYVSQTNIEF